MRSLLSTFQVFHASHCLPLPTVEFQFLQTRSLHMWPIHSHLYLNVPCSFIKSTPRIFRVKLKHCVTYANDGWMLYLLHLIPLNWKVSMKYSSSATFSILYSGAWIFKLSVCLSACLSVRPSVRPVRPSVRLSVCLFVCLSVTSSYWDYCHEVQS